MTVKQATSHGWKLCAIDHEATRKPVQIMAVSPDGSEFDHVQDNALQFAYESIDAATHDATRAGYVIAYTGNIWKVSAEAERDYWKEH